MNLLGEELNTISITSSIHQTEVSTCISDGAIMLSVVTLHSTVLLHALRSNSCSMGQKDE